MDDPGFICELTQSLLAQNDQSGQQKKSIKDRQSAVLTGFGQMMDLVTTRHRLLDAIWQSEILGRIYRKQGVSLGFEEFHSYLRLVQFEFAKLKANAGKPPPVFITAVQEDDSRIDRSFFVDIYLTFNTFLLFMDILLFSSSVSIRWTCSTTE